MTTDDPTLDEVRSMFSYYAGPSAPVLRARRSHTPRRLLVVVAVALLLAGASIASADGLGLFDGGTPVSPAMRASIAAGSIGAPAALDPGIEAGTAVTLITIPTDKGTVSLIASRATRASYCAGLAFSWLGERAGLGCDGPGGDPAAIDVGQTSPGIFRKSPLYVYGHVLDQHATEARIDLADGTHRDLALTDGFFLGELAPADSVARVDALDASGAVLASQVEQPITLKLPSAP
jgi:hypothetical protein